QREWIQDDGLHLSVVLRDLPQAGLDEVRLPRKGEEALPDSRRRLPDRVQEWQMEPDHGVGGEGARPQGRGPAAAPQRNSEEARSRALAEIPSGAPLKG